MSVRIMSAVWDIEGLKGSEKLVLLALADHADDDGFCWPSMARIAKKCDVSERGARGIIRRLEEQGYLETDRSGGRQNNRYTVNPNPEQLTLFSSKNPEPVSGLTSSNPETVSRKEVPGLAPNPETRCTNPETVSPQPGSPLPPNHHKPPKEPSGGGRKRATRLPDDWQLPKQWGDWAMARGHPETQIRTQATVFANYWQAKSGKDATKRDWFKTWQNWMIKEGVASSGGLGPSGSRSYRGRSQIDRFDADPELREIRDKLKNGELAT